MIEKVEKNKEITTTKDIVLEELREIKLDSKNTRKKLFIFNLTKILFSTFLIVITYKIFISLDIILNFVKNDTTQIFNKIFQSKANNKSLIYYIKEKSILHKKNNFSYTINKPIYFYKNITNQTIICKKDKNDKKYNVIILPYGSLENVEYKINNCNRINLLQVTKEVFNEAQKIRFDNSQKQLK